MNVVVLNSTVLNKQSHRQILCILKDYYKHHSESFLLVKNYLEKSFEFM